MVKPDIALDKEKYKKEDEFILVTFDAVRAIKDYIVVDKNEAKGL